MNFFVSLIKFFAVFFVVFSVTLVDMTLIPALGFPWSVMNMSFMTALFLVIIFRLDFALIFYTSVLLLQSLFAANFLLIPLLAGSVILFIVNMFTERLFTNRSYYVLIVLSLFGWILYHVLFAACVLLLALFVESTLPLISLTWAAMVLIFCIPVLVLSSLGYAITSFFSQRFKSYFITTSSPYVR